MTTNPTNPGQPVSRRVRASESALRVALRALKAEGVPIGKVVLEGGKIEIICVAPDEAAPVARDDGLESWDDFDASEWRKQNRSFRAKKKGPPADDGLKDW